MHHLSLPPQSLMPSSIHDQFTPPPHVNTWPCHRTLLAAANGVTSFRRRPVRSLPLAGGFVWRSRLAKTTKPSLYFQRYIQATSGKGNILQEASESFLCVLQSRSGDKTQFAGQRTKSLEERQKSYDESRKRIFGVRPTDYALSVS